MSEKTKRFWWLKLREDFFDQTVIKKLRRMAGGDTYTIIYLKMQLMSLRGEGMLLFDNVEDTFEEELALRLDEAVDDVQVTLLYMQKHGLIEILRDGEYMLPEAVRNIGSECDSAARMRNMRDRQRMKASQCYALPSQCAHSNVTCDTEREKETEKEIELELEGTPPAPITREAMERQYGASLTETYIAKAGKYGKSGQTALSFAEKWLKEDMAAGKVQVAKKPEETSLDLEEYGKLVEAFTPMYKPEKT